LSRGALSAGTASHVPFYKEWDSGTDAGRDRGREKWGHHGTLTGTVVGRNGTPSAVGTIVVPKTTFRRGRQVHEKAMAIVSSSGVGNESIH
jgi:hypothetical protein